jgi:hypothetical protein
MAAISAMRDPDTGSPSPTWQTDAALALAEELGMRPLGAHCHLGLGTLYRKTGRIEQAQVELATAAEMYRAMEITFWLARAEAELRPIAPVP